MLLAGDEFATPQTGNNNAFALDNETSWLQWDRLEKYKSVHDFVQKLIAIRKQHPVIRKADYFTGYNSSGYPELSWHGETPWNFDRYSPFLTFAFMYSEPAVDFGTEGDSFIYCAVNAHWEEHTFTLPIIPAGMEWRTALYSGDPENGREGEVCRDGVTLMPRSVMILIGN